MTASTASNRRSRNLAEGVARAPNRSMYYGIGYKECEFGKPMIGVANGHSTITPCNAGLQKLADAAIEGLRSGNGAFRIVKQSERSSAMGRERRRAAAYWKPH